MPKLSNWRATILLRSIAHLKQAEPPEVVQLFEQQMADYQAAEQAGFLGSPATPEPSGDEDGTILEQQVRPSDTVEFISGESLSPQRGAGDRPGPLLADDYEILDEIGRGGMGTVYRAYQLSLRRHVAVKIIPTNLIRSPEEAARFYIEAEAAAKLEHPGIVQVQDVGERNGVHYYTMARVTGGSLADFVGKEKRLTRQRAAEVMEAVSRAVQFAHDRAVIHRDIKPANIMLDGEGRPRLTDFGLAKLVNTDDHLTMTGQVMGTPSYMAPEQAEGDSHAISNRTDVYSLGATLYALLAGKAPFSGETLFSTLQQVQKSAPAPLPTSVPLDLRTICNKCLEKDPNARYQSAGDLADDLRNYLDGFPISARRVGRVQRTIAWARRNPFDATMISGFAAAVLVGLLASNHYRVQALSNYDDSQRNLAQAETNAQNLERAIQETFVLASEDFLVDAPGMEQTRRTLLENARRFFEEQLAMQQISGAKVAEVTARLGKVDSALGDNQAAQKTFDRAIELYESLIAETPSDSMPDAHWQYLQDLAQVHREYAHLGQLQMTMARDDGQTALALSGQQMLTRHTRLCAKLRQTVADALPQDYEVQRQNANSQMNLAIADIEAYATNDNKVANDSKDGEAPLAEAERLIAESQALRTQIKDLHPEPSKVVVDLARGHQAIAELQLTRAAHADGNLRRQLLVGALQSQSECTNLLSSLPATAQGRHTNDLLALSLQHCGNTCDELGATVQARQCFEKMLEIRKRLLLNNPGVSEYRLGVARAHYNLSDLLKATDESASFSHFRQCQDVLAEGPVVRPDDPAPVALLLEFTERYTDALLEGSLRADAVSHIQYGYRLLNKLPPASRNLAYIDEALEGLKKLMDNVEAQATDEPV